MYRETRLTAHRPLGRNLDSLPIRDFQLREIVRLLVICVRVCKTSIPQFDPGPRLQRTRT